VANGYDDQTIEVIASNFRWQQCEAMRGRRLSKRPLGGASSSNYFEKAVGRWDQRYAALRPYSAHSCGAHNTIFTTNTKERKCLKMHSIF